jgi:uncharacterized protein YbbK (DUF523 family)
MEGIDQMYREEKRKKIAISACLLGEACRYDGTDNRNDPLLQKLEGYELVSFCPEDFAFGTPRPTMDLVETPKGIRAISNETGEDLSEPVQAYAKAFFDAHRDIDLFIGKDRSPSCGVCSAKCYDGAKQLRSTEATGLMAAEAKARGIEAVDAEIYLAKV